MKRITLIGILFLNFALSAQDVLDVSRFSQTGYLGSTRFLSGGGAFLSLGNDFAASHLNPAGIAVFRKSEVNLTLGNINTSSATNSQYQAGEINSDKNQFALGNIGVVLKFKDNSSVWEGTFGISINQMANYNSRVLVQNIGVTNSRIESWIENAQGIAPADLLSNGAVHERMAWESFLIDDDLSNNYTSQAKWENGINQTYTLDQSGSMNELAFLIGGEKNNNLYLGASVNMPFVNFQQDKVYQEGGFVGDSISSFTLKEHNEISGIGFNLKLGAIYKFDNDFRIGGAIHTPTWFSLEQSWEDEMLSEFTKSGPNTEVIAYYSDPYNWNLTTPWKVMVGISQVFKKSGFLSVDYEYSALSGATAKADSFNLGYLNNDIENFTQNYHTIKFGGELRMNKFYLRGGYSIQTSGLTKSEEYENITMISAGAGYRTNKITAEVAYAIRTYQQEFYIYDSNQTNQIQLTQRPLMFTLAYRFGS